MHAYIVEHNQHPNFDDIEIQVLEPLPGKGLGNYKIVCLRVENQYITPKELRKIGRWMINQGREIGKKYKGNGKLKV